MKVLKFFLIALAIGIIGVLAAAGIAPKDFKVERSLSIEASNQSVFPYISNLNKMQEWSPWTDEDPNMEVSYTGKQGTVGSTSSWSGNSKVGRGSQEIIKIQENRVETKLTFLEPMEDEASAYFITEKAENNTTKVTWGMSGENSFIGRIFGLFMNMDEMIGGKFEKGLASLKVLVEKNATTSTIDGYTIETVNFDAKKYLIKRDKIKFANIGGFFKKHFPALFGDLGKAGVEISGAPTGIYYEWDIENMETDMAAAAPINIKSNATLDGYETINLETSKALKIAYYGSYEQSEKAHYAIDKYMTANNLILNELVIEEYLVAPSQEPDTSKWLTNIFYLIE